MAHADDPSREMSIRARALAAGWDMIRVDDGRYRAVVSVNGRGLNFRSRPEPDVVMTADDFDAFLDSL